MSENAQDDEALWQKLIAIGNKLEHMRGTARIEIAHLGLSLIRRLRGSNVTVKEISRVCKFEELLTLFADIVDADLLITTGTSSAKQPSWMRGKVPVIKRKLFPAVCFCVTLLGSCHIAMNFHGFSRVRLKARRESLQGSLIAEPGKYEGTAQYTPLSANDVPLQHVFPDDVWDFLSSLNNLINVKLHKPFVLVPGAPITVKLPYNMIGGYENIVRRAAKLAGIVTDEHLVEVKREESRTLSSIS